MKRLAGFLVWSFLFLALLLAMDQVLLRAPLKAPGYTAVREFYLDFRSRLLGRAEKDPIETILKQHPSTEPAHRPSTVSPNASPRYLYVDEQGALQFADSLKEIPPALRKSAKRLER